ncbi:MAG: site-2 protease family protein [Phycisphaeraceae bacterium]|nr:MAG: site-2 protease family protein [Phycisphaeraceae bacterium]
MNGWWVSDVLQSPHGPVILVSWTVVVIGSIVLHELSHGWAAIRLGDQTPRLAGHMTWNPLVHMGSWSLVAFAVMGIAWGAMPVDPTRLRGKYADALVAVAGPAMNILIALVSFVLLVLWAGFAAHLGVADPLLTNLHLFLRIAVWLNVVLALFNMLPIYSPMIVLDGGHIAANIFPGFRRFAETEHGGWIMLGVFILFFWFGFDWIMDAATTLIETLASGALSLFG